MHMYFYDTKIWQKKGGLFGFVHENNSWHARVTQLSVGVSPMVCQVISDISFDILNWLQQSRP